MARKVVRFSNKHISLKKKTIFGDCFKLGENAFRFCLLPKGRNDNGHSSLILMCMDKSFDIFVKIVVNWNDIKDTAFGRLHMGCKEVGFERLCRVELLTNSAEFCFDLEVFLLEDNFNIEENEKGFKSITWTISNPEMFINDEKFIISSPIIEYGRILLTILLDCTDGEDVALWFARVDSIDKLIEVAQTCYITRDNHSKPLHNPACFSSKIKPESDMNYIPKPLKLSQLLEFVEDGVLTVKGLAFVVDEMFDTGRNKKSRGPYDTFFSWKLKNFNITRNVFRVLFEPYERPKSLVVSESVPVPVPDPDPENNINGILAALVADPLATGLEFRLLLLFKSGIRYASYKLEIDGCKKTLEKTEKFLHEYGFSEPLCVDDNFLLKCPSILVRAWVKVVSEQDFDRFEKFKKSGEKIAESIIEEDNEKKSLEAEKKKLENDYKRVKTDRDELEFKLEELSCKYLAQLQRHENIENALKVDLQDAKSFISEMEDQKVKQESDLKILLNKYKMVECEKEGLLAKIEEAQANSIQQQQHQIALKAELRETVNRIALMEEQMQEKETDSRDQLCKYESEKLEILTKLRDAEANVSTLLEDKAEALKNRSADELGPSSLDDQTRFNLNSLRTFGENLEVCVEKLIQENKYLKQEVKGLYEENFRLKKEDEMLVLANTNLMEEVKALNQACAELEAKVRLANRLIEDVCRKSD